MKKLILIFLTLSYFSAFGQDDFSNLTKPIVDEGKRLYKSEMASWYGTDIFLEKYQDRQNIGGYFSYTENEISKCIFYSRAEKPKVIGTISFDSTYNTKKATIDLKERDFTTNEVNLFIIRKKTLDEISSDTCYYPGYKKK